MQAAVVNALGQPPRYQSFPDPTPNEGEVVIQVLTTGLHPIVKVLASGTHYAGRGEVPSIPGVDGVGTLSDGRRVYFTFARKPWGSMCERTVAPLARCLPVPEAIDDAQAAAIANPGMSALLSLKNRAAVAKGETVLILGATGVAGQLAIQVARYLGAGRVIAAGRNIEGLSTLEIDSIVPLGQSEDAVREAFAAEAAAGIDVVIDYLWGRPTELLLEALSKTFDTNAARQIRLVEVGESAGRTISLPGAILRSVDLKMMGSGFGSVPLQCVFDVIPTLFAMAASGSIRVVVEPVPLADVEQAWDRPEKGRRIVFTIAGA
jgi:NADPH2:quinone reductase